jgi:hypothetical protein
MAVLGMPSTYLRIVILNDERSEEVKKLY